MNPSQPKASSKDRGNFSWKLDGGDPSLSQSVVDLLWDSALDAADTLTLTLAPKDPQSFKLSGLPTSIELKWQDKVFFKGHLQGFSRESGAGLRLSFKDSLYRTERFESNALLKDSPLQDTLEALAKIAGVQCRFHGSFAETVPSRYLGGKSVFQHLRELSEEYGFFFFSHAPSEVLQFYRLGTEATLASVDWARDVGQFSVDVRADLLVSSVGHRYFDPGTQTGQTQEISGEDIYSPVRSLTQHEGFRTKKAWTYSQGNRALRSEGKLAARSVEGAAKNSLSKQALFQEGVWVRFWKPVAMPGDWIDLQGAGASLSGKYLVHRARLPIRSAQPYLDLRLVRP